MTASFPRRATYMRPFLRLRPFSLSVHTGRVVEPLYREQLVKVGHAQRILNVPAHLRRWVASPAHQLRHVPRR